MTAGAPAPARFEHCAFPYASRDEFVAGLAPFVSEGLERGDRVLAVTGPANREALGRALGADAAEVDFRDAAEWYEQPYRTLQAYARYIDRHADGNIVRVIGEPVWEGRSSAAVREWTRYESVLNAAFAAAPASIVCPYDTAALSPHIVRHAHHTHPELWRGADRPEPSCDFVAPESFVAHPAITAPTPAPADARVFVVAREDFRSLRRFVAAEAVGAGLTDGRRDDLLLAATELATNAARDGRRPVVARVWVDAGELVCEVEDGGDGFTDRLAGFEEPSPTAPSGRGLWIVRQLCDCVDTLHRDGRFAVRVRVGLGGAAATA